MNEKMTQTLQAGGISRRNFIKGTGASIAALAAIPMFPRFSFSAEGNILRVRDYGDFQSLDPGIASNLYEENINAVIYNKLIQYKPGDEWGWRLDAAEEIEQVDPTHIRFKLRPGILFTDGFGEMTAEDVKYSYERIIDPELESPIKGDWATLKEVQVKDKYNGVIVLKEPFQALWMTTLPYMAGNIISKKATEAAGGKYSTAPPCFSGPYVLKSWSPKQRTELARNPEWKGPKPVFDEIHIFPIDDEKTAEIAFEAGDIDYTRISLSSYEMMKAKPPENSTVKNFPSLYYVWVGMNMENPVTSDPKIRKAVQYAIDVPSVLQAGYFGVAEPATGIVPPGLIGHRPKNIIPREAKIDKAKKLLAEAGYPDGIALTFDVRNKSSHITAAQVIQASLAAAGIRLEINSHDSGSFWSLGDESKGDRWKEIQLVLNRFSSAPDPYYAAQWFTKDQIGVWNWERFANEEYNDLHQKAAVESDPKKRDEMYRRMQDLMEMSGAYHFITHEANPAIYRNSIVPALRPDGLPLLRYFKKA